jgi:hypothetical protein
MMSLSFFMSSGVAVCSDFGCGRAAAEEEAEVAMLSRERSEKHKNAAREQGSAERDRQARYQAKQSKGAASAAAAAAAAMAAAVASCVQGGSATELSSLS